MEAYNRITHGSSPRWLQALHSAQPLTLDVALVEKSAEEQAKLVQPVYIQQDQMVIEGER